MFGRKSRAERLKDQVGDSSLVPTAAIAAAYAGAKPFVERLLYDDELRDNIRVFIESARRISDELSGEGPSEVVQRLWDDDKLRKHVEAAASAAQQGSKRVRGEKVKGGGGGGKFFLLLLIAAVGFLFLNPRTGPQARKLASDAYGALTSD